MNRDDIQHLLAFYAAGTLTHEEQQAVEDTLRKDPSLAEDLAFWRNIKETAIANAEYREEHIASELLVAYLRGAPTEPAKHKIENHLKICSTCREEADSVRRLFSTLQMAQRTPESTPSTGKSRTFAYALAACLAIVVSTYVVLTWRQKEETPSPKYAQLLLRYEQQLRDPQSPARKNLPVLFVSPETDSVTMTALFPKSGIGSAYLAAITSPDRSITRSNDTLTPASFDATLDSVSFTLQASAFQPDPNAYELLITEILPPGYGDLTPEEYHYSFLVSDSSSHSRKP
jgi:hypothetical protein